MSGPAPLNALRAFEAVVRSGSFAAAAGELHVTQSAISHRIKGLEQWFGAPLFDREGPRPRPLPHAQQLARSLSLGFDSINAACRAARGYSQTRPLVVAAIPSVAVCWLIPRLGSFRAAHPGVEMRIVYALHGQEIDFAEVDFAFVFAARPPAARGADSLRLLPGAAVPVCSPQLAATRAAGEGDRGIAGMALLHDTDHDGWATWFARAGLAGRDPAAGPVFEDFNLLRAAALAGQGVALCPEAMIRDDLAAGRLVRLSQTAVAEGSAYYLLQGPAAAVAPGHARAFRDWVLAERQHDDRVEGPMN